MSDYIGKVISLVDKQKIRYVGVLASISAETSTVVLETVAVFGTEGRRNGVDEVPAESGRRQRLEFKGKDVEDLQVLDDAPLPEQTDTSHNKVPSAPVQRQDDDDEDFVKRTQRLTDSSDVPDDNVELAYNKKSSFFDNLSSQRERQPNYRSEERTLNMATFGEEGNNHNQSGNRRRSQRRGYGSGHGHNEGRNDSGTSLSSDWEIAGSDGSRRGGNRGSRGGNRGRGRGGRGSRGGRGRGGGERGGSDGFSGFQPAAGQQGSFFS